jgi:hypothetical protein
MEEIRKCFDCEYHRLVAGSVCIFPGYPMTIENLSQPCLFDLPKYVCCTNEPEPKRESEIERQRIVKLILDID